MTSFNELAGFEPILVQPGMTSLEITIEPRHLNRAGTVHGGMLMTLLDSLMGYAATSTLEEREPRLATSRMTTQFLEAVSGGQLLGEGRVVSDNGGYLLTAGELRDQDGRLIATAQGQFTRLRQP